MALSADAIVVATAPPPPGAAAGSARVELLQEARRIEDGVLIAGCAPLIATFAHRASGRLPQARVTWIPANSAQALALLAAGLVHAAGVHAPGANTPEQTCKLVRRQFPHQGMLVANFTRWRQGLVVAPGNPYGLRTVADLAGRRLRYAQREKGAAARLLSDELFTAAGLPVAKRPQGPTADNHWDVAEQVRWGAADAGIAIESVARLTQLGFVPLVSERFDLIVPTARAGLPQVRALFELLEDPAFRADAARIPGYDCTQAGDVIRIEGA
jgi:molybdate-binding protein